MKVREPVARPLDIVSIELLLSGSQAFLSGTLVYLAVGIWADRGVGLGPAAIVLGLVGLAVGASWLFWLLGGTGWPMVASNTPAALFLGFALLLGWQGAGFVQLDALPLLLGLAAAIYGIVGGAFLDSPRRWRWDQRQRLRPGTEVPRVSPATRALVARVPRSLPKRGAPVVGPDGGRTALGPPTSTVSLDGGPAAVVDVEVVEERGLAAGATSVEAEANELDRAELDDAGGTLSGDAEAIETGTTPGPVGQEPRATDRLTRGRKRASTAGSSEAVRTPGGIELPTSVEPKAQRSPWAWAAPPEWNRDEDDEPPGRGRESGS